MESIVINGGKKLKGEIEVQGSKNSTLPILAATVLVEGVSVIHNCPDLKDVNAAVKILEHLGCLVKREKNTLTVDSRQISCYNVPDELMREMRSSIVFLGSILSRTGSAVLSSPGGCEIGLRPIDLHLSSLKALGADITESHGKIHCKQSKTDFDAVISLSFPSVGATENIILACCKGRGRTVIHNAAREPEIKDLADFLCGCGCKIHIGCEGTIVIDAVEKLHGCEHRVIPDRIAALTIMSACVATGGDVTLTGTDTAHYRSVIPAFEGMGADIMDKGQSLRIRMSGRPKAVRDIRTMPYPGFPTDAQAPVMALTCICDGTSVIVENIFESRFKHVGELVRMGAKIKIEGKIALVDGVDTLYGANVESPDLRGGAALIVAGLCAVGTTGVTSLCHIDRGYCKIEDIFSALGADIKRIK